MILNRFFSEAALSRLRQREVLTLAGLLLGALVLFGALLLTSQKYADGDEAVVGIMARHILTRGARPLFFYGQVYGGGGAIEAYLAAIPFAIFGSSAIVLKSIAVCLWLAAVAALYLFCLRYYNYATAVLAAVILITATALIEWHLKMRGGYAATPLLFMLILTLFCRLSAENHRAGRLFFLFGLFCGAAYYNLELSLPFLFTILLFSLYRRNIFWQARSVLLILAGLVVGAAPVILFNLTTNFANFRYVLGRGTAVDLPNLLARGYALFTVYLPRFFVGSNPGDYVSVPPFQAYIEYALYLLLFIYLSIKSWPTTARLAARLWAPFAGRKNKQKKKIKPRDKKKGTEQQVDQPAELEILLLVYTAIYPLFLVISGNIDAGPRYLVLLYPPLALLAARGIDRLWRESNRLLKWAGIALAAALIACGFGNHLLSIGPSRVYDDVLTLERGLVHRQTAGENILQIIDFLNERQISRVWSTYFVQWRLIFESNEKIIASSHKLMPGTDTPRYPPYDNIVWKEAKPQAVILHVDDSQLSLVEDYLTQGYDQQIIGEYRVMIPK